MMTFTSFRFYLFLPVVYLVFCLIPDRWRWLVLLGASYMFYASYDAPHLLLVLLMVTVISYVCGLRISSQRDDAGRKLWLQIGVVACVAILALHKYLPFLESHVNSLFGLDSSYARHIISIGVSYFTFQAISYLVDVYLEIEEPEQHFGHFALYLSFFPKLLQGPIERAGDLIPQLKKAYLFNYNAMRSGMLLFTWGIFKKVVIADRLALFAGHVFNNVHDYTGLTLLIGIYAYALQIFFDFSAYTDMARGLARMFGIGLTENFNNPYLATSIADFWRRWHISFSRWILDYIFKPLQMRWRNFGHSGTAFALLVTFLISGIWHGATWGFVVWGLLHGLFLASSTYYKPYQKKIYKRLGLEKRKWVKWWQVFVTFNLVSFAWVFFRANSISDALYMVTHLTNSLALAPQFISVMSAWKTDLVVTFVAIAVFVCVTGLFRHTQREDYLFDRPFVVRWGLYYCLVMSIIVFNAEAGTGFIYQQF